jgi:hypothetical protein
MPRPSSYQNMPHINGRREQYFRPVLLCFRTSLNISGDYVKAHDLQQGDFIVIYKDDEKNRFVLTQFSSLAFNKVAHFFVMLPVGAYYCVLCIW